MAALRSNYRSLPLLTQLLTRSWWHEKVVLYRRTSKAGPTCLGRVRNDDGNVSFSHVINRPWVVLASNERVSMGILELGNRNCIPLKTGSYGRKRIGPDRTGRNVWSGKWRRSVSSIEVDCDRPRLRSST